MGQTEGAAVPHEPQSRHRDVLAHCLTALGTDPDRLLGFDVLAGGASGACAYRIRLPAGEVVLKVTRPESSGHLLERARREILFYRHLAPDAQIQVPKMIASCCNSAIGACLLLQAYEPPPEPQEWTKERYVQVAEHLGRLHAGFWGQGHELSVPGWLRRSEEPAEAEIRQARGHWERLKSADSFEAVLTPERHKWILGMARGIREARKVPSSLPLTLCHGDFHIDNILVDHSGGMVLADWHEVGLGRGPEDLSFFIQRASFSGGMVPDEEMLEAYRRSLVENIGEDVPVQDIRRVMESAELRTRLLHWPAFYLGASGRQLMNLLERIQVLAARLETTPASDSQE